MYFVVLYWVVSEDYWAVCFLNPPELKTQVSYSDKNFSGVCSWHSKLSKFLFSSPEPPGQT